MVSVPRRSRATSTPSEAIGVVEELEQVMNQLSPVQRRMVELRLQGYSLDEIASQTNRSERTIRRLLSGLKDDLERRLIEITPS